ncbi:MAG TPA: GNAT family N-acetyltransferase [Candidatus Saccharimonadales bacterium]|nr:GNAT family N-acetyltransferase [Candidatus Saccharimonadales bacterium]
MPFGPELRVAYEGNRSYGTNAIDLRPYTAASAKKIFEQLQGDPAVAFLGGDGPLWERYGAEYYLAYQVEPSTTVAWGAWNGGEQVGLAELCLRADDVVSYNIIVGSDNRCSGIGSLLTAGVVSAAFRKGLLAAYFDGFAEDGARAIATRIHERNTLSQRVCGKFGFVALNQKAGSYDRYLNVATEDALPQWLFGKAAQSSVVNRQQALGDYRVQVL